MLLAVLPFGAALSARLAYRIRWVWLAYFAVSLATFLTWLVLQNSVGQALIGVLIASLLGFVSPELWESLRSFLRKPRTMKWILIGVGVIFLFLQPQILGSLMTLGIVLFGLRLMIKPLLPKGS